MRIRNSGKNGEILRMLVRPGTNNNALKIENAMKVAMKIATLPNFG
jgi:hypothetical protein